MNTKVRFKMYKAGKRWMVMGIATATLALVPGGLAHAATNTDANAINTDVASKQVTPAAESTTTILSSGQLGTATDAAKWDLNDQGTLTIHSGVIYGGSSRPRAWTSYQNQIKKIVIEPTVSVAAGNGNLTQYFSMMPNLTTVEGGNNLDVSNVTNMYRLFWSDPALQSVDVSNWNTAKVTDMSFMFYQDYALTALNVANWNVGQVTTMRNMFVDDRALTALDVANWDISHLTSLEGTFEGTGIANLDVANWNTANVTNLDNTFEDMPITQIDVSKWDTSNVTDFGWMFAGDTELTQVDVSNFDTSKGVFFWDMFRNDRSLTSLDISNFDTTNATTDWNADALVGLTSLEKITVGPKLANFSTANLGDPATDTTDANNANTGKWQTVAASLGGTDADPKGSVMTGQQIVSTPVTTATTYVAQKKVTATIRFVDQQGNELFPATSVTGLADDKLPAVTIPTKENYHVVSDGTANAKFVAAQTNVYDVVYGDDTTTTNETKQITRQINYVVKGGLVKAPVAQQQVVNFTRTKTTDLVDGSVSYSNWQADGTFAAVASPAITGYQADVATVPAVTPQATDQDQTVTVTYQVVGGQSTTTPSQPEQTNSTTTNESNGAADILLPKTGSPIVATVAKTVPTTATTKAAVTPVTTTTNNSAAGITLPKTNEKKTRHVLNDCRLGLSRLVSNCASS